MVFVCGMGKVPTSYFSLGYYRISGWWSTGVLPKLLYKQHLVGSHLGKVVGSSRSRFSWLCLPRENRWAHFYPICSTCISRPKKVLHHLLNIFRRQLGAGYHWLLPLEHRWPWLATLCTNSQQRIRPYNGSGKVISKSYDRPDSHKTTREQCSCQNNYFRCIGPTNRRKRRWRSLLEYLPTFSRFVLPENQFSGRPNGFGAVC